MSKALIRLPCFIVAAIVLLAFALRLYQLPQESYWYDEIHSINHARPGSLAAIYQSLQYDVHPPFYFWLLGQWMGYFGESEFATRLLSALCGGLTVLMLYALGRVLQLSRGACLWACLFLAMSGQHLWYSQMTRMYALETFLGAAHLYALGWFLGTPALDKRFRGLRSGLLPFAFWLISIILLIGTHFYAVFFVALDVMILGLYALRLGRHPARRKHYHWLRLTLPLLGALVSTFLLVSCLAWLPLAAQLADRFETGYGFSWIWGRYEIGWHTPYNILQNLITGSRLVVLSPLVQQVVTVLVLVPIGVGLSATFLFNRRRFYLKRYFLWTIPAVSTLALIALPTLVSFWKPIILEGNRYLIIALPTLLLMAGMGLQALFRRGGWFKALALIAIAAYAVYESAYIYRYLAYREPPMWREAIETLHQQMPSSDEVLVLAGYNRPVYDFYSPGDKPSANINRLLTGDPLVENVWVLSDTPGYSPQETLLHAAGWELINNNEQWSSDLGLFYRITRFKWRINPHNPIESLFQLAGRPKQQSLSLQSLRSETLPGFAAPQIQSGTESVRLALNRGEGTRLAFPEIQTATTGLLAIAYQADEDEELYITPIAGSGESLKTSDYAYAQFPVQSTQPRTRGSVYTLYQDSDGKIAPYVQIYHRGQQRVRLVLHHFILNPPQALEGLVREGDAPVALQPPGDLYSLDMVQQTHFETRHDGYIQAELKKTIITNQFGQTQGRVRPYILNHSNNSKGPGSLSLQAAGSEAKQAASVFFRATLPAGYYLATVALRRKGGSGGQVSISVLTQQALYNLSGWHRQGRRLPKDAWQLAAQMGYAPQPTPVYLAVQTAGGDAEIIVDDVALHSFTWKGASISQP